MNVNLGQDLGSLGIIVIGDVVVIFRLAALDESRLPLCLSPFP